MSNMNRICQTIQTLAWRNLPALAQADLQGDRRRGDFQKTKFPFYKGSQNVQIHQNMVLDFFSITMPSYPYHIYEKVKDLDCGKKQEVGDFPSIDPYKTETVLR
jgi:hypothetical protein